MAEEALVALGPGEGPAIRLDTLTPDQLRTLAYASAIGREFDFQLLVAAMGASEEELAEQVERLAHLGILRERVGGDQFGFVQEELRARLYKSLTASRLRVLHRKIAEAMERLYPDPPAEIVPELGRHFFLGKVPQKSYEFNRKAAELARMDDTPEVAAHHLERARIDLRSLPGDHARDETQLAEELGDLYYSMGDVQSADRLYTEALSHGDHVDSRLKARLILARAEVARESLDAAGAVRGAKHAQELFLSVDDRLGVASVHRLLARIAFSHGAYRDALDEGMQALEILSETHDLRISGRLCIDIGNSFSMLGADVRDDAVNWYQRAIDRLREVGDWPEISRAYHNLAIAVGESHPAEGLEHLEQARAYAERGHESRAIAWSLLTGVEMRLALGQVEEAQRDNEQAGRLFERMSDELGLQQVQMNRGLILEKHGQWDDAERSYRQAIEIAERHDLPADVAESEYHLARLMFKTRNLLEAQTAYHVALRLDLPQLKPSLTNAFRELGRQLAVASTNPTSDSPRDARERPAAVE
ncbi:MAG: tetratricopeptide repeat protein [Thermoplasmata archaeon]